VSNGSVFGHAWARSPFFRLAGKIGEKHADDKVTAAAHTELFVESIHVGVNGTAGDIQLPANGGLIESVENAAHNL
jgi:hypothetical protein